MRRQPGLRRRRAARPHQLPELRQPREAARRMAADRGGRRAWPRPASSSACRSSAATCRSTTRRPPARSSPRRSSASSAGSPTPPGPAGSRSAQEGDAIALVGPFDPALAGSELAKLQGRAAAGTLPPIDPEAVAQAHREVREGVRSGALRSAHDIAEGGIAVALAECCIAGWIGATVTLPERTSTRSPRRRGQGFIVSGPARGAGRA